MGGVALAWMLGQDAVRADDVKPGYMAFPPKAKRVVQMFMAGAASHVLCQSERMRQRSVFIIDLVSQARDAARRALYSSR